VNWGRWACKIEDFVNFDIQGKGNVVSEQFKARIPTQVRDIAANACVEIVDTQHLSTKR
jgi:hypothetical protein